jgi:hypothetical protein
VQANVDNHSFEEAERIQIKQLDNYGPFGRVDPLKRADALATLGWIRIQSGKYSEAEQVLLEACTLAENEPGAAGNCDSFVRVNPERRQYNNSGEIMTTSYMCAIQLPESVWPFANRCAYGLGSRTPKTGVWIGRMFEQWGKPQQVKEWIAKLQAHPPKIH